MGFVVKQNLRLPALCCWGFERRTQTVGAVGMAHLDGAASAPQDDPSHDAKKGAQRKTFQSLGTNCKPAKGGEGEH